VQILRRHELEVHPGAMSTLVVGEEDNVFAAVKEAFHSAIQRGDLVMAVTLSNACPAYQPPGETWADR
jgi:uncharacterized protein YqgV (UPF0045/DUF77 family)